MARLNNYPKHLAIIMDGNRRWAKEQSKSAIYGHEAGVLTIKRIIKAAGQDYHLESLSLFALSSENWSRPSAQVVQLMQLFEKTLKEEVLPLHEQNIRLQFVGNHAKLPQSLLKCMKFAEEETASNTKMNLNIALNYGGRWDITRACSQIAKRVSDKELSVKDITEELVGRHMTLAELPPIDLCIRTGNEKRISNFFLWQLAYTELFFSPVLWPDFQKRHLAYALSAYAKRDRRFGKEEQKRKKSAS